jgi:formamidopyrimidine-DNA glycosylase
MPEILEVEAARALIEAHALDREIATVHAPDAWFLKRGLTPMALTAALPGHRFVAARRRGKLLLIDTDGDGPTLGMHLGMSGRVIVDGQEAGDPLIYASNRDVPEWRRFGVSFADGGTMWLRDPRRLGAVELDPDEDRLGPDALSLTRPQLDERLDRSAAPVKALLMNQAKIAGLGNLLVDEVLWRAGVAPTRPARSLDADERARLLRAIRTTLRVLGRRGGSHTGDLTSRRLPDAMCPRDGTPLVRSTVAGRTTFSCPLHQH